MNWNEETLEQAIWAVIAVAAFLIICKMLETFS